ncbi:hypothetical protein B0H19DRAFT_1071727 [Mycena capillaripes]|nr:hypothetical protein B0H19DRAFT_1071727 [Mycena capillaripes]
MSPALIKPRSQPKFNETSLLSARAAVQFGLSTRKIVGIIVAAVVLFGLVVGCTWWGRRMRARISRQPELEPEPAREVGRGRGVSKGEGKGNLETGHGVGESLKGVKMGAVAVKPKPEPEEGTKQGRGRGRMECDEEKELNNRPEAAEVESRRDVGSGGAAARRSAALLAGDDWI